MVNNHRAKLILSGIADPATLEYGARLVGEAEVDRQSRSTDADGRTSTTDATQFRPLAPADALRRIAPGEALAVYGHLPPARLRLRPWYEDKELQGRMRGAGEETAIGGEAPVGGSVRSGR